jgi:tetratricopeptide (TPR) repeat protein
LDTNEEARALPGARPLQRLLRALPRALLWAVACWPVVILGVGMSRPLEAVALHQSTMQTLGVALRWGAIVVLALAVLVPPFPAGIRVLLARLVARLRADRGPFLHAIGELRHLETAARQLEAGRAALGAMDARAAIPHLVRALALDPELIAARYQLGLALLDRGALREAAGALHHVVDRDPTHAFGGALLWLARCHQLGGNPHEAMALFGRHEREHGGNRRSHYWLAQSRAACADRAGAHAAFAIAAAPRGKQRLSAEEGWYRALARVALWRFPAATTRGAAR